MSQTLSPPLFDEKLTFSLNSNVALNSNLTPASDPTKPLRSNFSSAQQAPFPTGAIGVFDSGLGGLSVLRALSETLPGERFVYVADSKHAPYGAQSDDFIAARSLAIGGWLAENGAKMLVVACNTATAHAIAVLRSRLAIPIVGVEPGVKPAALATQTGVVGILATEATLRSARFADLLARHGNRARFVTQAGHGLVEAIERGDTDSPEVMALLESYLRPMIDAKADCLVLGCTHYPFLASAIRSISGDPLAIVDTSAAVARQAQKLIFLAPKIPLSSATEFSQPRSWFFSADLSEKTRLVATQMHTGAWESMQPLSE